MHVLVVDDDDTTRLLLEELLKPYGTVQGAANGLEALKSLEATRFDLILLDINMPDMDGNEVLATLRIKEANLGIRPGDGARVFMVSGTQSTRAVLESFRNEADAFLKKPVDPAELFQRLEEAGLSSDPAESGS